MTRSRQCRRHFVRITRNTPAQWARQFRGEHPYIHEAGSLSELHANPRSGSEARPRCTALSIKTLEQKTEKTSQQGGAGSP